MAYDNEVAYASEQLRSAFPNDWFSRADITSLISTPFGALTIPIPNNPQVYLERVYGIEVWETAYADYDHANEQKLSHVPVRLITRDCAPDLREPALTIP